jgi:phage shock protein A
MFRRFMMAMRSFFGLFVRGLENPELMLQQYMDDMKSQVPRMNDNVAEVMKQEIMLRGQSERLQKQINDLDQQVIAAVKLGPQYEEEAKMLLSKMEQAKADLASTQSMLTTAQAASEQAKRARDDYMRQLQVKIQEAQSQMSRVKQAKMQEQLSNMMMSFNVGDNNDTLERMSSKIEERSAKAQAKMDLATNSVDSRLRDVQRATTSASVDSKLLEYKRQLGMAPAEEEEAPRTMAPVVEPPQTNTQ